MTPRRTVPVVIALASTSLLAMVTSNTLLTDWVERHAPRHPNPLALDAGEPGPVEAAPPQDWPAWGGQPPTSGGPRAGGGATPPPPTPAPTRPAAARPSAASPVAQPHSAHRLRYVLVEIEEKRIIVLPPLPQSPKPPVTPPPRPPERPQPPRPRRCACRRHRHQPQRQVPCNHA